MKTGTDSKGKPHLSLVPTKRFLARAHYEPSVVVEFRPKCKSCGAPNPHGVSQCPGCGIATQTSIQYADAVHTDPRIIPFHARILLSIGAWLRSLSTSI